MKYLVQQEHIIKKIKKTALQNFEKLQDYIQNYFKWFGHSSKHKLDHLSKIHAFQKKNQMSKYFVNFFQYMGVPSGW